MCIVVKRQIVDMWYSSLWYIFISFIVYHGMIQIVGWKYALIIWPNIAANSFELVLTASGVVTTTLPHELLIDLDNEWYEKYEQIRKTFFSL